MNESEKILKQILDQLKLNQNSKGAVDNTNNAKSKTKDLDNTTLSNSKEFKEMSQLLNDNLKKQDNYLKNIKKIVDAENKLLQVKSENQKQETLNIKLAKNLLDIEVKRTENSKDIAKELKSDNKLYISNLTKQNKLLLAQKKTLDDIAKTNKKNNKVNTPNTVPAGNPSTGIPNPNRTRTNNTGRRGRPPYTFNQQAGNFAVGTLKTMTGLSGGIFGFITKILSSLLEQDSVMSKLSANYALSKKESGQLKLNITNAAIQTNLIGVRTEDLVKMQSTYTDELGRSVMLTEQGMISMSQLGVATGIGAEGAAHLAASMELFGYGAEDSVDLVENLMKTSKKMGVSTSVATKNLQENLKIANSYTFKNGLQGVIDMTAYSTKFKINMSSIAGFADKISNPEGAIQAAASLQVLGGSFAQMADPLKMLNQGINDMEGLTDTYSKMLDGIAKIDKKTGEVTINGYDRLRVKAAAEATGISFDEMMTTARNKGKRQAIDTDLNLNPNIKGNNETKDLIASLAEFTKGKGYNINVGGKTKTIAQLSKEDIQTLQPKAMDLNIKTVAENTLGITDILKNGINAALQALVTKMMPVVIQVSEEMLNILHKIVGVIGGNPAAGNTGSGTGVVGAGWDIGKMLGKNAVKGADKGLSKLIFGEAGGKMLGKRVPILGSLIDAGFAAKDFSEGDYWGAGLNVASGVANLIPGVGTAASVGIDAFNAARELGYGPSWMGNGKPTQVHDMIMQSGSRNPIKLDSKDDVFAAKPGGAFSQALSSINNESKNNITAISPSTDVSKTYNPVEKEFSSVYGGVKSAGKFDLNISGTINLTTGGPGGSSATKISATELVSDRNFLRELTRIIGSQMNRDKVGGKYAGSLGNNSF